MTLQSSGNITILDIQEEIEGAAVGGFSLLDAATESGKSLPVKVTDFYGYYHAGKIFGYRTGFFTATPSINGIDSSNTGDVTTTEAEVWQADLAHLTENTKCTNGGPAFKTIDGVTARVYRRGKGSLDAWVLLQTWGGPTYYKSEEYTSHNFAIYDYKWELEEGL